MTVHVDARGLRCPWPALRLARAMRDSAVTTIVADDPAAPGEIAALAAANDWQVTPIDASTWRVERSVN